MEQQPTTASHFFVHTNPLVPRYELSPTRTIMPLIKTEHVIIIIMFNVVVMFITWLIVDVGLCSSSHHTA